MAGRSLNILRRCHRICWNCKYFDKNCNLITFCQRCNIIQKPNPSLNYYDIFLQP
ncbi:hypothetical protein MXB_1719 [Myxobolus squamalis]|nr:hypothetical protein MXB_1719 [Myxobolus squamalis]